MLSAFERHGLTFAGRTSSGQRAARCPFCGEEGHFFANEERGLWDCKSCGASGNPLTFVRKLLALGLAEPNAKARLLLARDRRLKPETLAKWGVGWNALKDEHVWGLSPEPGGPDAATDLRTYRVGGKPMSTTGLKQGFFWCPDWRGDAKLPVWICEGEWDAMATWEALRAAGRKDDVVGAPGASFFPRKFAAAFAGRNVRLCYDADEPGQRGMLRTWKLLDGLGCKRQRVEWPESSPTGYDMRDLYRDAGLKGRTFVQMVEDLLRDALPQATAPTGTTAPAEPKASEIDPNGKGLTPKEVLAAYRRWLDVPCPEVLDVLFGAVLANRMEADPLWMFFVAPPGGCKSELLMTLADAPLIYCVTSLTPHALISGSNTGGGDPSLLPRILGRTLVVKDFTTILTLNQTARDEIFGTLRDAYDGRIAKTFGNHVTRSYEGKFGIVGGVTPVIDGPASASTILGERFLKCRIRSRGKLDVGRAAILRALDNITSEGKMREELKEVGARVLNRPVERKHYPAIPQWFKERMLELAQWVSAMRGTVSRERYTRELILCKPTAEVGTRLAKQLCTLGLGVGVYHGKRTLDEDVYRVVAQVAVDTAPDRAEELVRQLYIHGDEPVDLEELSRRTRFPHETCRYLVQDLTMLHITARDRDGRRALWMLTPQMRKLILRLGIYEGAKAWTAVRKGK